MAGGGIARGQGLPGGGGRCVRVLGGSLSVCCESWHACVVRRGIRGVRLWHACVVREGAYTVLGSVLHDLMASFD